LNKIFENLQHMPYKSRIYAPTHLTSVATETPLENLRSPEIIKIPVVQCCQWRQRRSKTRPNSKGWGTRRPLAKARAQEERSWDVAGILL
jgi:hypothetical protein